jgi:hypothetical protein
MTPATRKRVLIATLVAGCICILGFETWRIWKVLSGPPQVEEYVRHLDFQLLASAFVAVTTWLPLLGALLLLEIAAFSLLAAVRRTRSSTKEPREGEGAANR